VPEERMPEDEQASEPLLEYDQRVVLRLLLNDRQGYQVPVDPETRLLLLAHSRNMHFRQFPGVDGLAANRALLFEDAKFFEARRELESA
jgi:hypothetical protein